jgi:hypothetical protein
MKRKFRFAPVFPSCPVAMALVFANLAGPNYRSSGGIV